MFPQKLLALSAIWAPVGAINGYFSFRHITNLLLPMTSEGCHRKTVDTLRHLSMICHHQPRQDQNRNPQYYMIIILSSLCPFRSKGVAAVDLADPRTKCLISSKKIDFLPESGQSWIIDFLSPFSTEILLQYFLLEIHVDRLIHLVGTL